jgi:phage/plasmid primase-like uncharacterized protein
MKALILAVLGLLLTAPLAAAIQCGATEAVLTGLAERYQEQAVARGLMPDGSMAMVTATADGVTWTLLLVKPDGQSCLMASGRDWEAFPAAPAGTEG